MSINVRWAILLVLVVLAACSAPATGTPSPAPPPPVLLGYVGDPPTSPAVFVEAAQGMVIEISEASYDPVSGRLTGYTADISYPDGDRMTMAFVDISRDAADAVSGYQVQAGGAARQGPPPAEFVSQFSAALGERKMVAFAPAWKADRQAPGYQIFVCPGIMGINYDIFDGHEMVSRQEIACEGETTTYAFKFDDYSFDKNATLTGFSVRLEVLPN